MTNQRMKLLAKLIEVEKLHKLAQATGDAPIDPAKADQMAEHIFDELFDEAIKNLEID